MCVPVCYFEAKEVAVSAAGRVLWGTLSFYAPIIQPFLSVSFKTIIFTSLQLVGSTGEKAGYLGRRFAFSLEITKYTPICSICSKANPQFAFSPSV